MYLYLFIYILYFILESSTPKHAEDTEGKTSDISDTLDQSGSGNKTEDKDSDAFISKVAHLVGQKLQNPLWNARPVVTAWTNFDTSLPSTAITTKPDTTAPLHYNNPVAKNDENDTFGNLR
jgi:hypothetical protein